MGDGDKQRPELPDELALPLRKPLVTAKGEVTTLDLREPTAGEFDKFERALRKDGSVSATLTLMAMITEIDKPFLERLGARDFQAASDYLGAFFAGSPDTGATLSPT